MHTQHVRKQTTTKRAMQVIKQFSFNNIPVAYNFQWIEKIIVLLNHKP